jgi:hypothetical protein
MANKSFFSGRVGGLPISVWAVFVVVFAAVLVLAGWRGIQFNPSPAVESTVTPQPTGSPQPVMMPPFQPDFGLAGIYREVDVYTYRPERPRFGLTQYTIQDGDTAWSIAQKFDLRMESILWGNEGLSADAGSLQIGNTINILPVDGVLHTVREDDHWERIELLHGIEREVIIAFIGNPFAEGGSSELVPGQQLIIPGGRNQVVWLDPGPQVDPSKGRKSTGFYQGPLTGIGTGVYILPVSPIRITQPFWEGHPALDFDTVTGQPVYAADGGTVIYAGWSESGYGNLVIIDHSTGYWTYYAHNDVNQVDVGQAVYQGQQIARSGNTGRSTGDHLDFRIRVAGGAFIDPTPLLPLP